MNQRNFIFRVAMTVGPLIFSCVLAVADPPKELLSQMDSEEFQERSKAYAELRKWTEKNIKTAPEQLFSAWKTSLKPEVRSRVHELMREKVIQRRFGKGKGFIGIHMQETVIKDDDGKARIAVMIASIRPKTPAEKSGLQMNDVILGVDKMDFGDVKIEQNQGAFRIGFGVVTRFGNYIKSKQPGDTITLDLQRGKKRMKVDVTLMKRPADADVGMLDHRAQDNEEAKQSAYFREWMKSMAKK